MICRVATFKAKTDIDTEEMRAFRAWMAEQPGFRSGYHVVEAQDGKALSISFWDSVEDLSAMADRTHPGGSTGVKPETVEVFNVVHGG